MGKIRYCLIFLCLVLLVGAASAAAPVANFTASLLRGAVPLPVLFTDLSLNSPTGWAWYFGDENFTAPWNLVNASAGWTGRDGHSSVAMPNGNIVLMGGFDSGGFKNDVWRSTDNGTTWTQVNASAGWTERFYHTSVAMRDGSIVLMGGDILDGDGGVIPFNDVWRSTDNGTTWTQVNASAGWSPRTGHTSVAMRDGSIVLMGGFDGPSEFNDVWRSTDNGTTWTEVNASAGWTGRDGHTSVAMPNGNIMLMGGFDGGGFKNDVWRSTDLGTTWTQMNANALWTPRYYHNSIAMPDGSIVLMGGTILDGDGGVIPFNDVWRSTDLGTTWTLVNASAGWSPRTGHTSVAMRDGSIVFMGGFNGPSEFNDVWRFNPVTASEQNPSHIYAIPGIYKVALQVYNTDGYNSTRKTGYITVTSGVLPLPGFSTPPTDPDSDGFYEDLNANGFADWDDAVVLFWNTDWIQDNEPVAGFDFNKNTFIDWDDAVVLFWEV